jgi:hypothetical protein
MRLRLLPHSYQIHVPRIAFGGEKLREFAYPNNLIFINFNFEREGNLAAGLKPGWRNQV